MKTFFLSAILSASLLSSAGSASKLDLDFGQKGKLEVQFYPDWKKIAPTTTRISANRSEDAFFVVGTTFQESTTEKGKYGAAKYSSSGQQLSSFSLDPRLIRPTVPVGIWTHHFPLLERSDRRLYFMDEECNLEDGKCHYDDTSERRLRICLLNENGTQNAFGCMSYPGLNYHDRLASIHLDAQDRLILFQDGKLSRLTSAGLPDLTFGTDGSIELTVKNMYATSRLISVQGNDIYVMGALDHNGSFATELGIEKIIDNGIHDSSFGEKGIASYRSQNESLNPTGLHIGNNGNCFLSFIELGPQGTHTMIAFNSKGKLIPKLKHSAALSNVNASWGPIFDFADKGVLFAGLTKKSLESDDIYYFSVLLDENGKVVGDFSEQAIPTLKLGNSFLHENLGWLDTFLTLQKFDL